MDHLFYPKNSPLPPLEIPFLCVEAQDDAQNVIVQHGDSFLELFRYGALETGNEVLAAAFDAECSKEEPEVAASWVQAICYFGLLNSALGTLFRVRDFVAISSETGKQVVSLKNLKSTLAVASLPVSVGAVCHCLERSRILKRFDCPTADLVCLSIEILGWSLMVASNKGQTIAYDPLPYRRDGILQRRMLGAGWCPRLTRHCCETFSAASLYYISSLNRSELDGNHDGCDEWTCIGSNVNMESYVTKHTTEGCSCSFMGPDPAKVVAIIQRNGIPVVRLPSSLSELDTLDVFEAEYGRPFTAISHVWSGGLGNPSSNALPRCQLQRLSAAMRTSSHHCSTEDTVHKIVRNLASLLLPATPESANFQYFWIDTLCIPVDPEAVTFRKDAINNMAYVYAAAKDVLVVDPTISSLSSADLSDAEILMSLIVSVWMTRAWTFQEGSLAQSLKFLLHDAHINLREWVSADLLHTSSFIPRSPEQALFTDSLKLLQSIPNVMSDRGGDPMNDNEFPFLWSQLAKRSTTKGEDLHAILAVLLRLSVKEILELPTDQRTKAILRSQDRLPLSMLYLPPLQENNARSIKEWIPVFPQDPVTFNHGVMTWSANKDGLRFSLDGDFNTLAYFGGLTALKASRFSVTLNYDTVARPFHVCIRLGISQMCLPHYLPDNHSVCFAFCQLGGFTGEKLSGIGACFHASDGPKNGTIHLNYICPITFEAHECIHIADESRKCWEEQSIVQGTGYTSVICFMDLGPSPWYDPIYRRAAASALQKSLAIPVTALLFVFWSAYTFWLTLDARIEWDDNSMVRSLVRSVENETSWAFWMFWWPFRPVTCYLWLPYMRFISSHQRALYPFVLPLERLSLFAILELPRLNAVTRRLRYERFARSFNFTTASPGVPETLPDDRLGNELSYQYRPWWTVLIPTLWAAWGLRRQGRTTHPNFYKALARGLIIETALRVGAEIAWRYFRLDTRPTRKQSARQQRVLQQQASNIFPITPHVAIVQEAQRKEVKVPDFWREPVEAFRGLYLEFRMFCWDVSRVCNYLFARNEE